jgi:predicted nuclease of predicted toxin-antitoxin system
MKLLLDEHLAPVLAQRIVEAGIDRVALREWHAGSYLELPDDTILSAAYQEARTLVTYDLRTIPPLLKTWAEQGIAHGGVIFVDTRTIAPNDIGGLMRALLHLATQLGDVSWENRVVYLGRG